MAGERIVLCGSVSDKRLPARKREPLRLRMWGDDWNVRLRIQQFRTSMATNVSSAFLDLLDIATYVYSADGALRRANGGNPDGGNENRGQIGDGWRRRLHFRIPVRRAELWRSEDVQAILCDTLGFLSDDHYSFEFEKFPEGPKELQPYLEFGDKPFDGRIEEVMLFSGGLDSLAGAVRESIVGGREVALVGHRSTSKTARSAEALVAGLAQRAARKPVHLPFRVNKKKKLGREFTQRTRSFLFASLGATVAATLGRPGIRFYENGVVSLNLPIAPEVVGARATRTTHPRVLQGFAALFSRVAEATFTVENPFFRMTKTDVVASIAAAGCAELIAGSRSCAHTIQSTTEHPHCGTCSQCIDRRFATLAARQEAHDPAAGYAVDLVTGARDEASRKLLLAYVDTASRIENMAPEDFFPAFGEIARALPYVDGGAEQAAMDVYGLFKRHASQVNGVVERAFESSGHAFRTLSIEPTSLIGLLCASYAPAGVTTTVSSDSGGAALVPPEFASQQNLFRRQGDYWAVSFEGRGPELIRHSLGMEYLSVLLSRPGRPTSVLDLDREVRRDETAATENAGTEMTDRISLARYREHLDDLRKQEARAKDDNDDASGTRIAEEIDALLAAIREVTGPDGRIRQFSDDRENARKRVGAAVRRAIDDIREYVPTLAAHLRTPTLRLGSNPCYQPAEARDWHLSDSRNSAALREK